MTKDLSIENLCGGAVQERINRALRKVSDNILDVNTEAKKKKEHLSHSYVYPERG